MGFTMRVIITSPSSPKDWISIHVREKGLYLKAPSDTKLAQDGIVIFLDDYIFLINENRTRYRILSVRELYKKAPQRFVRRNSKGNENRIDLRFSGIQLIPIQGEQSFFSEKSSGEPDLFIAFLHFHKIRIARMAKKLCPKSNARH